MFTLQASNLRDKLTQSGLPVDAVDALVDAIGTCTQELAHRGPVTISYDALPTATNAALTLDGFGNYPEGATPTVPVDTPGATAGGIQVGGNQFNQQGPFALAVNGVAKFNGPVVFGGFVCGSGIFAKRMVMLFCGSSVEVPAGWAIMDGTNNSVANGGSGINMTGFFVRGASATPSNASFGADDHVHDFAGSGISCFGANETGDFTLWALDSNTGNYTGVDVTTPGHATVIPVAHKELYFIERLT